ncbi:Short chain dehydrogenase [Lachnellula willkommii]|uniref:Short chain dehydrogenase n=1 Tax=Lachnellula willkommii TaxID=215461 RepID=A0A559MGP4_9HELO|nr:Short chain dehydrogenase [Lachnellula willkommii]
MSLFSAVYGTFDVIISSFIHLPYPTANASIKQQTVIVTGANTGLGLEASRHLVRLGVDKLIMGVRNLQKGEDAKRDILASTKRKESCIEVWLLDMDSSDSVKTFASRAASLPRLDAVLANAGILTPTFSTVADNERTIATNVVSTFLLCMLVLPKLRQSAEQFGIVPRFVIPNSALHYMASLKELDVKEGEIFKTLNDPKTADMGGRYPLSKLLVIYAVRELADRTKSSQKPPVIINTPNPSYCKSGLVRDVDMGFSARMMERILARSTEMGSRALVHGLLSGAESNGQYLSNCHVQTPASSVTNSKGKRIQKSFFNELIEKLENIAPGIMSDV